MTSGHELFLSRRGFMAGAGTLAIAPPARISLPATPDNADRDTTVERELLDAMNIRPVVTTWPLPSNQRVPKDPVSLSLMVLAAERMVDLIGRRVDIGPGSPARTRALLMLLHYVHHDVGLPSEMPDFVHRVELAAYYLSHHLELLWPGTAYLGDLVEKGRVEPGAPRNTFPHAHTIARFNGDGGWRDYLTMNKHTEVGPVVWQSKCGERRLHRVDNPMGAFITGVQLKTPWAYQFAKPPVAGSAFRYPDDLQHLLMWRFIASGAYHLYAFRMKGQTNGFYAVCTGTLFDGRANWFLRYAALPDFIRSLSVGTRDHGPLLMCGHRYPLVTLDADIGDLAQTPHGAPWTDRSCRFVIPRDYGEVV